LRACSALRAQIVAGTLHPEAAFVNAAMVPGAFVLQLAAHKALAAAAAGKPTTRTLHSDLVFNLSPSNNARAHYLRLLRVRKAGCARC
jgi:tRNA threonylcarbamoyladenosine modification (KEOPS) complex Cgi121 subunit